MTGMDQKTLDVIEKVRKLLAMANGNANENEAAIAAAKAAQLLEAYNLDMAVIGASATAKRKDQKRAGGLYQWQRNLWYAVAKLNFCHYTYTRGLRAGEQYEHQIIGSQANVISTEVMAEYLQSTVERLARYWVKINYPNKSVFIKPAIAYREGVATSISNRIWTLRNQKLAEDEAKRKADREAARAMGVNTENALILQDVINTEEDLNNDYIWGYEPGTSAMHRRQREAKQAKAEADAKEALRKQAEWDLAHPELAAKRKAKDKAQEEEMYRRWAREDAKRRNRKPTAEEERRNMPSFYDGYDAGQKVSLDKQVDNRQNKQIS